MIVCRKPYFRALLLISLLPAFSFDEECSQGCADCFLGICGSCKPGYYGKDCDHTCDDHCTSACEYNLCLSDCETGWFGSQCQHLCFPCVGACLKNSGRCIESDDKDNGDKDNVDTDVDNPNTFGTVAKACGAVVAVGVILFVIAIYCRKRRNDSNDDGYDDDDDYNRANVNGSDYTNAYGPGPNRTPLGPALDQMRPVHNRTVLGPVLDRLRANEPTASGISDHSDTDSDTSSPILDQSSTGESRNHPTAPPPPPSPAQTSVHPLPSQDAPPSYSSLFPET